MNYYNEIKTKLLNNEIYEKVKDYSKERHRVLTYFEIGRLLHEAGKQYGEGIISTYAFSLTKELGKKYNKRTLYRMRQFYETFSNIKWSTVSNKFQKVSTIENESQKTPYLLGDFDRKVSTVLTKLTWSHYLMVFPLNDENEIYYYINTAISKQLSVRQLEAKIKSKEYERLYEKTRIKLINNDNNALNIKDYVPNPIYIKNNSGNKEVLSEKFLHGLIMEDIASFMKQLGEGYAFIESEYKIKIDDRYNYIDLLLYNLRFRCYVVVELKITEFKSEYIGQILKYMHYIDNNIKSIEDDNTIGIIIVKRNNNFYLEYVSDERVISREYKIV